MWNVHSWCFMGQKSQDDSGKGHTQGREVHGALTHLCCGNYFNYVKKCCVCLF